MSEQFSSRSVQKAAYAYITGWHRFFARSRAIRTEPISFSKCCIPSLSDVTVNDVILSVHSDTWMTSGGTHEISLDLAVLYALNAEATSVHGRGLWTTKLWVSRFADGSDELSGTVVEEALTEEQQSLSLRKNPVTRTFSIDAIIYRFDLTRHTCNDAKYICAEFNKGQNPELERDYLVFHFQAKPTNGVLIDCIGLTNCNGKNLYAPWRKVRSSMYAHSIVHHYHSASICQSDLSTICPLSAQLSDTLHPQYSTGKPLCNTDTPTVSNDTPFTYIVPLSMQFCRTDTPHL